MRRSTHYFPELESLRGVAIMLVFLYHVAGFVDGTRGHRLGLWVSPLRAFVHGGQTGVSLFFVLSAFLLSLPFLAESAGGTRVERWRYFERRALRILPLYWAAVVATSVVLAHRPRDLLRGVPYLFFLQAFPCLNVTLVPLNGVWWSLATEVQFYLLLPLLPWCLRRPWRLIVVLLTYSALYALFAAGTLHAPSIGAQLALSHSLFGRAPLFVIGIAAAWVYRTYGDQLQRRDSVARLRRAGVADSALIAVLLGLGYLLRRVVFVGYWGMEFAAPAWHVLEGALWATVLLLLLLAPLHLKSVLSNRFLELIGRLSYSIYLVHVPLLYWSLRLLPFVEPGSFTGWKLSDFGIVAILAAACVATSAVTYASIERPFLVRKAQVPR